MPQHDRAVGYRPQLAPARSNVPPTADLAGRSTGGPSLQQSLLELQRAYGNRHVGQILRQADGEPGTGSMDAIERAIDQARGGGYGLDTGTRARMETAFGADFSGVRLHTDTRADRLSDSLSARAFTTGRDIFFGEGEYSPGTSAGRELLAHELTHVVQQNGSGLQRKMTVSDPGDAHEVEADAMARAVIQQEHAPPPTAVQAKSQPDGVDRLVIQRDEVPGAAAPAAAPVASAPPATTPGAPAAPGAQPATGDQVALDWWVDWEARVTGQTVDSKSNARTGKDAAQGTLKILPAAGAGSVATFKWVNAAPNGSVHVGTMNQLKDKGGMVSTDIAWGKPPSAGAVVTVTETADDKKHVGKAQLGAKQKAASAAVATALDKALVTEGGVDLLDATLRKAAETAVGSGGDGYSYSVNVNVKLDRGASNPRAVSPVPYDGASADDRRTATIVVPTDVQKLHGTSGAELEKWVSQSDADKSYQADAKSDETLDAKTNSLITDVSTSFEAIFNSAYENWKKQRSTTSLGGEVSVGGNLKGSAGAGGSIKDLTLDIGSLLSIILIENPVLAFAVKKAIGKGTVGGEAKVALDAYIDGHVGANAQWTKEDLDQTLTKIDSHVTSKIKTSVHNEVHNTFTHKTKEDHQDIRAKDSKTDTGSRNKSSQTSETIGVKYIIGEPKLHVTNG